VKLPAKLVGLFLAACLAATLAAIGFDAWSRLETVKKTSAVSFSETPPNSSPLPAGCREETLMLPQASVDARWWVVHTREMLRTGDWRVRHSGLDNAPAGREVHWSSFLVWTLSALAWILSWGSGEPVLHFVADAALAAGPVLMVFLLGGLAIVSGRVWGWPVALFYLLVLLTSRSVVRPFFLGEADHHGIVLALASASLLALLASGCGYLRTTAKKPSDESPARALRRWVAASGIVGGAALWVSASTALPILAGTAAGILASGLFLKREPGWRQTPGIWLLWGASGCLSSLGFYLLEYFPNHMGLRLEVNHPLYALAWLGGGWLIDKIFAWRDSGRFPAKGIASLAGLFLSLAACAAPIAAILFAGNRVFWVSDPFLLALHKEYIMEFQSLLGIYRKEKTSLWVPVVQHFWIFGIVALLCILALRRAVDWQLRRDLCLLAPPVLVMQLLAVWQVRWGSAAAGLWALVALAVFTAFLRLPVGNPARGMGLITASAAVLLAFFTTTLPTAVASFHEESTALKSPLPESVGGNLLLRDVARRLAQSSPEKVPTVLTGPNSSTELTYQAGLKTLGTLYWENTPGLKSAARIFSAQDSDEALRLLTASGVTHIVVPSWDNFAAAYNDLLAKTEGRPGGMAFFKSILENEEYPTWLRPFAYPIPSGSGIDSQSVRIFAVLPSQNAFESWFHRGIYHLESGQQEKAKQAFEKAAALRPTDARVRTYLENLPDIPSQPKQP
jgi:hypothetical protein